jgi:serine/threonine protein kinase
MSGGREQAASGRLDGNGTGPFQEKAAASIIMSKASTCPSPQQIREFLSGRLDEGQSELIAAHLESCVPCRRSVSGEQSTAEDHDLRGDRLEATHAGHADASLTLAPTPYDPTVPDEDLDRELLELFPDRHEASLGWIDDYEVQAELGRGGMGLVFKGFDRKLHRVVAIKVMSPRLASSERARRRFLREARAAAGINHPNVVTIHAVGEYRGIPYLVMEYVAGRTLRQRIHGTSPLAPVDLIRISTQVADGLAQAHAQGVIHRDIKPANILLEDTVERVKIADFGLALVALDVTELTSAGQVIGTPSFMAPEQVLGQAVDPRTDLFSLGCVMYAMVTGRSPFAGSHTLDAIRRVCDEVPPPLDKVDPRISKSLAQVVSQLMEKKPEDRFQSAAEAAEVLRQQLAVENRKPAAEVGMKATRIGTGPSWAGRLLASRRSMSIGATVLASLLGWWLLRPSPTHVNALLPKPPIRGPVNPTPRTITVSRTEAVHHPTIKSALDEATPGSTIRILDDAVYSEAVLIADPERLQGVVIESPARATLKPPAGTIGALSIKDTPGVTVRGLRLVCSTDQHVALLEGGLEGVTLETLDIEQPAHSQRAAIFVTEGTHGSPARPVRLSGLKVDGGAQGLVIAGTSEGTPASSIRVERCRFKAREVLVVLHGAVRDATVADCIFTGGNIGLNLYLNQPGRSSGLHVQNNTFFNNVSWIGFGYCEPDQKDVVIERNLVAGSTQVHPGVQDLTAFARAWFRDNLWQDAPADDLSGLVARRVESIRWVSTDEASPDYVRPADATQVTISEAADGRLVHAGAVAPAAPSVH